MSDCRVPTPDYGPVARIHIEFDDAEVPFEYPIILSGRTIEHVFIDGVEYVPKFSGDGR